MKNLTVKADKASPEVEFNFETGELLLAGSSYPENALEFFDPVIDWVENYLKNSEKKVVFNFKLVYFNTSSSKALLDIMDILNDSFLNGREIQIKWYYKSGNESIFESGEEFAEDMDIPFEIIEMN